MALAELSHPRLLYLYIFECKPNTEISALKNFYSILSIAHQAGKTIANLDSIHIQSIMAIAENNTAGKAAQKAQNALCFHYDICYDAQGQPKSNTLPRAPKPTYQELISQINTATAYPNPTDQHVTIAYTLLQAKEETYLTVIDNLGRPIANRTLGEVYEGQQLIDTRKLANGIYFYRITQEGQEVGEGKFVVTH